MCKQKVIVLLICGSGVLAGGLGARVEPGVGSNLIPLFSYDTNCSLSTEGSGRKVAKVWGTGGTLCGGEMTIDLESSEPLTVNGAILAGSRDVDGGCSFGTQNPSDCNESWGSNNVNVDVKWSISASTSQITIDTTSRGGLSAEAEIGPGMQIALLIGATAKWRVPYGADIFFFRVPFTVNADTTKIHVVTEQVHSSRGGTWSQDDASMIWSLYEDENGDCSESGEALVTGPHSLFADNNDGTVHGPNEGMDIDLPSDVESFVLRLIFSTDNLAIVSVGGCGASATQGGRFSTGAKLVIEPTS